MHVLRKHTLERFHFFIETTLTLNKKGAIGVYLDAGTVISVRKEDGFK